MFKSYWVMAGGPRIQTYFGVSFPPWKGRTVGNGAHTIWFVIKGRVPSKKNNQQAVTRRDEAVSYLKDLFKSGSSITPAQAMTAVKKVSANMRGNDQYKKFVDDHTPALLLQREYWQQRLGEKGLIFPIRKASMNIRFYFAQKYRQDSVNKQQSVQDILKDCKIIQDDDYTVITPITSDGACYFGEMTENLTFISLSFKL